MDSVSFDSRIFLNIGDPASPRDWGSNTPYGWLVTQIILRICSGVDGMSMPMEDAFEMVVKNIDIGILQRD